MLRLRPLLYFSVIACLGAVPVKTIAASRQDSTLVTYQYLMSRLINPELKNELQVLQWAVQYDSLFERLVDINTKWNNEDLRLIRIVQEFIPVFLMSRQHSIRGKLFITYRSDVQQTGELFSAMGLAYNQIVSLFREKLRLSSPTGYIFVLVVKDRDQMGDDELGGFVIRASRFVVIPQAYYYQYGVRFLDLEQFSNNFKKVVISNIWLRLV